MPECGCSAQKEMITHLLGRGPLMSVFKFGKIFIQENSSNFFYSFYSLYFKWSIFHKFFQLNSAHNFANFPANISAILEPDEFYLQPTPFPTNFNSDFYKVSEFILEKSLKNLIFTVIPQFNPRNLFKMLVTCRGNCQKTSW